MYQTTHRRVPRGCCRLVAGAAANSKRYILSSQFYGRFNEDDTEQ